eukprot:m.64702 g.64702  ORF g.64702 m.64702 type:complete len:50 (-) comp13505_c0_seq1:391-540(-)
MYARIASGGEECLYDTQTARELQARKRQWTRDFEAQKRAADQTSSSSSS